LYIIFSDRIVEGLVQDPVVLSRIQTYKGLGFVLLTSIIIFLLIMNEFSKHRKHHQDISEKYILELKEKNHFIQTVLNNLPLGVALNKFQEGHATYMNKRFVEIYGWPQEELSNIDNFFKKVYPDREHRRKIKKMIMDDIESGDPERLHWENMEITRQNGEKRIVNAVNIPLLEQNTMVSTVIDITDLKESEISLKDSKAFITNILDNLPVGISVVDKNYNYIYFNKVMQNLSGRAADQVIGNYAFDIFPYLVESGLSKYMKRSMQGERVVTDDYKDPSTSKSDRWFYSTYYPNRDAVGNIIGVISQVIEITERKISEKKILEQNNQFEALNEELMQTNEELFKAKNEAEESDKLKTAFLQNMSHEIRTPLNGVVGYAELLKNPDLNLQKRISYSNIITRSSSQLLSIVSDIITISTLDTRQESLKISEVNLNELLKNLRLTFKESARKKDLKLSVENGLSYNDSFILTDEAKLTQILNNLVSNSLKFTEKGFIEIGYMPEGKKLKFYVKDSGIGIASEMHEKVFERFCQAEIDSVQKYGGTGLGLSISRGLTELLGGEIWLESEPGQGSVFYFTIDHKKKEELQSN
jgi:PAS domain S-box-containing protein